jgi:hypothetical protein
MKSATSLAMSVILGLASGLQSTAKDLATLKVLYVGSERAADYVNFLHGKVAQIEAKSRAQFNPADADPFDVVLFDWPQGEETREMRKLRSPLGARESWHKPTLLLGSAGLNLAVTWKLKGGSGCTCLEPMAYDLHSHEIFERPFAIDRGQMISIATPSDFQAEIDAPSIQVLPLVDARPWHGRDGWCTYSNDFDRHPDIEFFCGGVNHKTPTAAGLWRQGNLLHFGFEPSPAEMNEAGQRLLLNSIAYISRFTEDRPIAATPSVFAGPIARPRATVARWLRNDNYRLDSASDLVAASVWKEISALENRGKMAEWAEAHERFLHPNADLQLEIDEDLAALGVAFDEPAFWDKTLADLNASDERANSRAMRLLERYVPGGPQTGDAAAWTAWWKENQPYAFASDASDYRWYVDPLAKKRGVPTHELRGSKRADRAATSLAGDM